MAGPQNYATKADMSTYLPTTSQTEESSIWDTLLSVASRQIDRYCGRYFYDDGASTKFFDGDGTPRLFIPKHDFHTVSELKVVVTEGASFTSNSAYTFSGDGVTPPSNFYCEPANASYVGKSGDTSLRPYYYIVIPQNLYQGTSGWLPVFTDGRRTVSLTASWGWPAVPDEIKDMTVKLAIRMWKARAAGWTSQVGDADYGTVTLQRYLDIGDLHTLDAFSRPL